MSRNEEPGFFQTYHRDTGELLWDISSPIYVKGQHWGGFRVGVQMGRVEERTSAMLKNLLFGAGALFLLTIGMLLFQLSRSLRPVRVLTAAAEAISVGEQLDVPLHTTQIDELGQLTRSIDRLRISMQDAITRLGGD